MKEQKVLINFQIPISMKERFDRFCEITGKSKTSVLNSLVEDHLIRQVSLEKQKRHYIETLDKKLRNCIHMSDII